jgi:D-alanyl-D-alanine carboxypeptidase
MKALFKGILILVSFLAYPAFAYQCGFDQAMTEMLTDFIDANNIPGVAVSIKLPDHSICNYAIGVADVVSKKPMTDTTLFSVGSINKSFTSVALLQLEQSGKLKLSDKLSLLAKKKSPLAILIKKYPHLATISVQELLNHTSGVPEVFTAHEYEKQFMQNPEFHTDSLKLLKLALDQKWHKTGEFNYTNTDYILAGMVIEAVTEKPLAATINHLLAQAAITNAWFPSGNDTHIQNISQSLAQGYMPVNPRWPAPFKNALKHYPQVLIEGAQIPMPAYNVTSVDLAQLNVGPAASGMLMSTPDMIKWYEYLFLNKDSLAPAAQQKLVATLNPHQGAAYGFGIVTNYLPIYDFTTYSHNGSFFGYNTNLIYIKNNNIIIALAINSQRDKLRLNQELTSSILDYLKGAGYFAQYAHENPSAPRAV